MSESGDKDGGWRVKVYQLREDGEWDDKGTGRVHVTHVPSTGSTSEGSGSVLNDVPVASSLGSPRVRLFATNERDGSVLINVPVSLEDIYNRQGRTIICWHEPGAEIDLAFSFQEEEGCQATLEALERVRSQATPQELEAARVAREEVLVEGRRTVRMEDSPDEEDEDRAHDYFASDVTLGVVDSIEYEDCTHNLPEVLPLPTRDNLEALERRLDQFVQTQTTTERLSLSVHVQRDDCAFLQRLVEVFRELEEEPHRDIGLLRRVLSIIKSLFTATDQNVLEVLLSDRFFFDVVGAFEYDPGVTGPAGYRDFLKNEVRFRQVVPIEDEELLHKIHTNFRVNFVKDVLLPRAVDDPLSTALSGIVLYNNAAIVQSITEDRQFLAELFAVLRSRASSSTSSQSSPSPSRKRPRPSDGGSPRPGTPMADVREAEEEGASRDPVDGLQFLAELLDAGKAYAHPLRAQILNACLEAAAPLFDVFEPFLKDPDEPQRVVFRCLDVMLNLAQVDQTPMRRYMLTQARNAPDPLELGPIFQTRRNHGDKGNGVEEGEGGGGEEDGGEEGGVPTAKRRRGIHDSNGVRATSAPVGTIRPHEAPARCRSEKTTRASGEHGHLVRLGPSPPLLHLLVWRATDDPDPSIQQHAFDILTTLLDPESLEPDEREEFHDVFFRTELDWLLTPLAHPDVQPLPELGTALAEIAAEARKMQNRRAAAAAPPRAAAGEGEGSGEGRREDEEREEEEAERKEDRRNGSSLTVETPNSVHSSDGFEESVLAQVEKQVRDLWEDYRRNFGGESSASSSAKLSLCELLTVQVEQHMVWFQTNAVRKGIIPRMLRLCLYREKHVVLGAVRFFRACLQRKETLYDRALVDAGVFPVLLALFITNGARHNLLGSAILEVFRELSVRKSLLLLSPLMHRYRPLLDAAKRDAPTLKDVIEAHDAAKREEEEEEEAGDTILRRQPSMGGMGRAGGLGTGLGDDMLESLMDADDEDEDEERKRGKGAGAHGASSAADDFLHDILDDDSLFSRKEDDEDEGEAGWGEVARRRRRGKPILTIRTTREPEDDGIAGRGARMGLKISTPPASRAILRRDGGSPLASSPRPE